MNIHPEQSGKIDRNNFISILREEILANRLREYHELFDAVTQCESNLRQPCYKVNV